MASARPAPPTTGDLFEPRPSPPVRKRAAALPWGYLALMACTVAVLLWGAWVTRSLVAGKETRPAVAAVRLQQLVAEYVEAQARTASPEEQVTRETRAFMARLDAELARRGRAGTTILVAEAVLSRNVPDITDEVRSAVHAAAPLPAPAAAPVLPPAGMMGGAGAPGR